VIWSSLGFIFQCEFNCASYYVIQRVYFRKMWYGHLQPDSAIVITNLTCHSESGAQFITHLFTCSQVPNNLQFEYSTPQLHHICLALYEVPLFCNICYSGTAATSKSEIHYSPQFITHLLTCSQVPTNILQFEYSTLQLHCICLASYEVPLFCDICCSGTPATSKMCWRLNEKKNGYLPWWQVSSGCAKQFLFIKYSIYKDWV